MKRWCLALWLLTATISAQAAVDAAGHDAFWVWGGVASQPALAHARTLYILQGQVATPRRNRQAPAQLIAQGMAMPRLTAGQVWLAYRVDTLHWPDTVYRQLFGQVQRWAQAGIPVVGIQVDFDARTRYLDEYVAFLRDLRHRLPAQYHLSITGLMDWSSNADAQVIGQLQGVVDEVVVQTYQGRRSIPDYAAYLPRLSRLGLPFKVGLIQGGDWQAPDFLGDSPWFRGYVVFLQNPAPPEK